MTDRPAPSPHEQQPMGAENHPVKSPLPDRTQLPPGREDDALPIVPSPEPDA